MHRVSQRPGVGGPDRDRHVTAGSADRRATGGEPLPGTGGPRGRSATGSPQRISGSSEHTGGRRDARRNTASRSLDAGAISSGPKDRSERAASSSPSRRPINQSLIHVRITCPEFASRESRSRWRRKLCLASDAKIKRPRRDARRQRPMERWLASPRRAVPTRRSQSSAGSGPKTMRQRQFVLAMKQGEE